MSKEKVNPEVNEQPEVAVGMVLSFDKQKYQHAIDTIEKRIVPAMADVVAAYDALGIGKFNPDVWSNVCGNNLSKIREAYKAEVVKQANKLGAAISAIVMDEKTIESSYLPFRKSVEDLHAAFSMTQQVSINALQITLSDCLVVDGKPVADKEAIEARFTVCIQNEAQIHLLELMGDLKAQWDKIRLFLKARPGWEDFDIYTDRGVTESLSFQGDDGFLQIDNNIVSALK